MYRGVARLAHALRAGRALLPGPRTHARDRGAPQPVACAAGGGAARGVFAPHKLARAPPRALLGGQQKRQVGSFGVPEPQQHPLPHGRLGHCRRRPRQRLGHGRGPAHQRRPCRVVQLRQENRALEVAHHRGRQEKPPAARARGADCRPRRRQRAHHLASDKTGIAPSVAQRSPSLGQPLLGGEQGVCHLPHQDRRLGLGRRALACGRGVPV